MTNQRDDIFLGDVDRHDFLKTLAEAQRGRRLRLQYLLFIVFAAAVALWRWVPPPQPSFEGQTALWWFARTADPTNPWTMQHGWLEAASASDPRAIAFRHDLEAFHKMGPEVVPYLLSKLRERPRDSSPKYRQFYALTPPWTRLFLPRVRGAEQAEQDRRTADLILKHLGPEAYPAVPELIQMLKKGGFRERLEAINILRGIGLSASNALPALVGLLSGSDPYLRVASADAVRHIKPSKSEEMLEVYRQGLQSKEKLVQQAAVSSLWEATRQPELVVPALTGMLGDPDSGTFACTILKQCGQSASNAVPALIAQLDASRLDMRVAAAAALASIAPEAETRRVEKTLAAGKAARLLIYGLEYHTPGF